MSAPVPVVVNVYPLEDYTFGVKEGKSAKTGAEATNESRFRRMRERYEKEGLRRSVYGVLLVHQHKHPYALVLCDKSTGEYTLPGGRIAPGEDEIGGLVRRLDQKLGPPPPETVEGDYVVPGWSVGESLSVWWRPHFDVPVYPFLPAHVSRPAECSRVFAVALPPKCAFAVQKRYELQAVPLYDLFANSDSFGPVVAGVPESVSRFNLVYL